MNVEACGLLAEWRHGLEADEPALKAEQSSGPLQQPLTIVEVLRGWRARLNSSREALAACLARLEAAPEDRSLIDPFVRALYSVTPTDRREAVDRAQTALGGRADELVELGQALYRQSFPGCELMAVEVSLAALRAGASWSQVVETIVGALGYVDRLEDAEPVVNEGLELTDRDPQLLTRWIQWLADHGQPDRSGSLAREALAACLARLEAAPRIVP